MAVHHHLDGVPTTSYAEREAAVVFRLHILTGTVVDLHAVHLEAGTLHGDAGAFVPYEAREALTVDDDEVGQRFVIALRVEGHGRGIFALLRPDVYGLYTIGRAYSTLLVRQLVGHEVSAGIGGHCCHFLIGALVCDGHLHLGSTGTVVEAYEAIHATGILTVATGDVGLTVGNAFTVVRCANLIFIRLHGRHGLVLVAQVVDVRSNLFPRIIALSYLAAQHGEVVDGVAVGIPTQHDAALARLRHQRLLNLTVAGVIELMFGHVSRGRNVLRIHVHVDNGYEYTVNHYPAAIEVLG